jgi:hypothetical protein
MSNPILMQRDQKTRSTFSTLNPIAELQQLSKILNVPIGGWSIKDISGSLRLVHYDDEEKTVSPPIKTSKLRGVIVDLETSKIVLATAGFQPEIDTSAVPDELQNAKLYKGYDGINIRIWSYNGVIRFSSFKKIDAQDSKWIGNGKMYYNLWLDCGGADFLHKNEHVEVGDYLMSHKDLQLCLPVSQCEFGESKLIFNPPGLTVCEANELLSGDGLVVANDNGCWFRLISPGLRRKLVITDSNPNLKQRFLQCRYVDPADYVDGKKSPLENARLVYANALCLHRRSEVFKYIDDFASDFETLLNKLMQKSVVTDVKVKDRIQKLLSESEKGRYSQRDNLKGFLLKENPDSLYRLLKWATYRGKVNNTDGGII